MTRSGFVVFTGDQESDRVENMPQKVSAKMTPNVHILTNHTISHIYNVTGSMFNQTTLMFRIPFWRENRQQKTCQNTDGDRFYELHLLSSKFYPSQQAGV